jgi:RNA polymerase sigma-70 factor (ECF subfamily)
MLRSKEQAEEALQEAYIKIWYKADYYQEGQGTVLTWMVSIVRYRALDMLRHSKVRGEQSYENLAEHSDDLEVVDTLDEQPPLSSANSAAEKGTIKPQKIETCMNELSHQQRQAIHLAYHNGLSHSEVTKHLDSPLGTIKSAIKRGLEALQRCLSL